MEGQILGMLEPDLHRRLVLEYRKKFWQSVDHRNYVPSSQAGREGFQVQQNLAWTFYSNLTFSEKHSGGKYGSVVTRTSLQKPCRGLWTLLALTTYDQQRVHLVTGYTFPPFLKASWIFSVDFYWVTISEFHKWLRTITSHRYYH